jgi:hypothetical protein
VLHLAGLAFDIGPSDGLTPEERRALARLTARRDTAEAPTGERPFRLTLVDRPPWTSDDERLFPRGAPAIVRWDGTLVLVSHAAFTATLDPARAEAHVYRRDRSVLGVMTTLRTALCCRLPLVGGLPLHAAGIVLDGRGLVFFGPSGAGKSTLARLSPHPVLSDELVAVVPGEPFAVRATGFCRPRDGDTPGGALPLRALVELHKGPRFQMRRTERREAVRRLIGVATVPAAPPLWATSLAVIGALAHAVPCYRMAWSPAEPPWPALAQYLTEQP